MSAADAVLMRRCPSAMVRMNRRRSKERGPKPGTVIADLAAFADKVESVDQLTRSPSGVLIE